LLQKLSDNISSKIIEILPSPRDSTASIALISSKIIERSTTNMRDTDYHQSLRYRNIYINRENPFVELIQRARKIISRIRIFPELDNIIVQKLKDITRRFRNKNKKNII
jgi:hypothetical protein